MQIPDRLIFQPVGLAGLPHLMQSESHHLTVIPSDVFDSAGFKLVAFIIDQYNHINPNLLLHP